MGVPELGERFDAALVYAHSLHGDQQRRGTGVPYIAHLMGVTALVLEDGGDEDEAIAALLHDAAEDQGGKKVLKRIRKKFGDHVADIVEACSDSLERPKPPWKERKARYISHLREPDLPEGALRVSLADKLYNTRALLLDLRAGEDVFARYKTTREDRLWYYRQLTKAYNELSDSPMAIELARVVSSLERESGSFERESRWSREGDRSTASREQGAD